MPEPNLAEDTHRSIGAISEVHGPVVIIACSELPPLRQALCTNGILILSYGVILTDWRGAYYPKPERRVLLFEATPAKY